MRGNWRYVQPGLNQTVVVLKDIENPNRIWMLSLDCTYVDHQGWHVNLYQTTAQAIARWRWRRNQ